MTIHSRHAMWALALALIVMAPTSARTQMRFARGQNVAPAFEGWERNPDGTFNMVFGYLNRNYDEQVDIPIGPNNSVDLGGDDRGQPTHFYPRRQRFVFKVAVPKDWDKNRKVAWTLTSHGRTDVAKGWLQPEWELNQGVYSENNGGGVLEEGNQAPVVEGRRAQTITLPSSLTLKVSAIDDGLPKPPRRTPNAAIAPAAAAPANPDPNNRRRRTQGLRLRLLGSGFAGAAAAVAIAAFGVRRGGFGSPSSMAETFRVRELGSVIVCARRPSTTGAWLPSSSTPPPLFSEYTP